MFERFVAGTKVLFRLHNPGRTLEIFPDDLFLVSFPKSGNTWTRFLVANLVNPECPASFANIYKLVPDPEGTAKRHFDRMPRPRIIKSHTCFDPAYPRVIYIVRDPRDVALSQYHYHRKRRVIDDQYPIETFVARFIAGDTCSYGSWAENVSTWLVTRRRDSRFLLLRYEDMIADTARELAKIASFMDIATTREQLLKAVERSSADNMRKLEKMQSHMSTMTKSSRQDLPFVRSASKGGWRTGLPEPLVAKIEAAWAPLMQHLGYELSTRPPAKAGEFDLIGSSVS
jgi:Sulfotransferase domain